MGLKVTSLSVSASFLLFGDVIVAVRGVLRGVSGLKTGCLIGLSMNRSTSPSRLSSQLYTSSSDERPLLLGLLVGERSSSSRPPRPRCVYTVAVFGVKRPPRDCTDFDGVFFGVSGSDRELERTTCFSRTCASSSHRKNLHRLCCGCWHV